MPLTSIFILWHLQKSLKQKQYSIIFITIFRFSKKRHFIVNNPTVQKNQNQQSSLLVIKYFSIPLYYKKMHNFYPKCFAYQNILVNVRRPHMGTHGLNGLKCKVFVILSEKATEGLSDIIFFLLILFSSILLHLFVCVFVYL